jgi:hypothetical protein
MAIPRRKPSLARLRGRGARLVDGSPGHVETDGPTVGVDFVDDFALVDHCDPVAEFHDLVELLGDQEHAGSRRPLGEKPFASLFDRSDIQAPCGLVGDENRRLAVYLPAQDELLEVPSREVASEKGVSVLGPATLGALTTIDDTVALSRWFRTPIGPEQPL